MSTHLSSFRNQFRTLMFISGSLASLTPTLKPTTPFQHAAAAAALYPGLQLPFPVPASFHMSPNVHIPSSGAPPHQSTLNQATTSPSLVKFESRSINQVRFVQIFVGYIMLCISYIFYLLLIMVNETLQLMENIFKYVT